MIEMVISPQCKTDLMDKIGVTRDEAVTTLNDRHRGYLDEPMTRLAAIHWFSDDKIVMIDGIISKKRDHLEGDRAMVTLQEFMPNIVIALSPLLPQGSISRDMDMPAILAQVAGNFAERVRGHPSRPVTTLYSGPWDGNSLAVESVGGGPNLILCGSFLADRQYCEMVYAFDVAKYLAWFESSLRRS